MKEITNEEFTIVAGLLHLAKGHTASLKQMERAIAKILGKKEELGYFGHVSDAVYSGYSPEELCQRMNIKHD